jgi:hypothetical protein
LCNISETQVPARSLLEWVDIVGLLQFTPLYVVGVLHRNQHTVMDSALLAELIPAFLASSFSGIQKASHLGYDAARVFEDLIVLLSRNSLSETQTINVLVILQQNIQFFIGSAVSR